MIRKTIIGVLILLALGTGALWIVGYYRPLWATFEDDERGTGIRLHSSWGQLGVVTWVENYRLPRSAHGEPGSRYVFHLNHLGFCISQKEWVEKGLFSKHLYGRRLTFILFPHWFVFLCFAAYPAAVLVRGPLRCWRRRRKGCCITCGYDVTGNMSGRCPECGRRI
ncbi:MAG: hypothetical protein GY778_26905 [bacterium]|nr:hypothetical protein [bacterium]